MLLTKMWTTVAATKRTQRIIPKCAGFVKNLRRGAALTKVQEAALSTITAKTKTTVDCSLQMKKTNEAMLLCPSVVLARSTEGAWMHE